MEPYRAQVTDFAVFDPPGTAFGGWKTRDAIPMLVEKMLREELKVDHFITHRFDGVGGTAKAIEALHGGDCLRAVVNYYSPPCSVD